MGNFVIWLILIWAFVQTLIEGEWPKKPRPRPVPPAAPPPDPRAKQTCKVAANGKSITCLLCSRTSYDLYEIRERYCVYCNHFHL